MTITTTIPNELIETVLNHAGRCVPREACGLIVRKDGIDTFVPCKNIAHAQQDFVIAPEDWIAAEQQGKIVMVVHSHVNTSPQPSLADRAGCEASRLPWLIVSWPSGAWQRLDPSGFITPLKERPYCYGVLDCYTLVRDYFKQKRQIEIPDFKAPWGWWLESAQNPAQNLFVQKFEEAGFVRVAKAEMQSHDVIIMRIRAKVANHVGVYTGKQRMLQHLLNQVSGEVLYGGWWSDVTEMVVRHRELTSLRA